MFLILYVDDTLLIGNDMGKLYEVKVWLAKQFDMKDLREAAYILGIQIFRDRKNRTLSLSQASYIDKVMDRFSMQDSKKGRRKTAQEIEDMRKIPYASAVGSLMFPTAKQMSGLVQSMSYMRLPTAEA